MRIFMLSLAAAAVVAQEQPHAVQPLAFSPRALQGRTRHGESIIVGRHLNDIENEYTVLYGKKFWGKRRSPSGTQGGGDVTRVLETAGRRRHRKRRARWA
ncbi:hypothetical protein AC1031_012372 [Aphanomyces cochlioides]|nr:hypothetical protein AC1031_012372 [Aphanomyces cochlioides]